MEWLPWDPGRRCWTCGALPDHEFPDGSPAYACGGHDPVVLLPPYPWPDPPALDVSLSDTQLAIGRDHARRVAAHARAIGAKRRDKMTTSPRRPSEARMDALGFLGELAAAAITGLDWNPQLLGKGPRRLADIGSRVEVRSTASRAGPLRAYDRDSPGLVFLLMQTWNDTGWRRWRAIGWLEGVDLIAPRHRVGDWWEAPRIHLRPLPLPDDA